MKAKVEIVMLVDWKDWHNFRNVFTGEEVTGEPDMQFFVAYAPLDKPQPGRGAVEVYWPMPIALFDDEDFDNNVFDIYEYSQQTVDAFLKEFPNNEDMYVV